MPTRGDERKKVTQKELNEKRDKENKEIREKQKEFDEKFDTQKHRAETSESGGKFRDSGGKVVTFLDRETSIRLGIERARAQNKEIRDFEKLSEVEKDNLRQQSTPRAPDNEQIGPGVFFRDIDDQKRVKDKFTERINNTFFDDNKSSGGIITDRNKQHITVNISESLGFSEGGQLTQSTPKGDLSAREQSQAISKGIVSPFFIGTPSGKASQQLLISAKESKTIPEFPAIFTDEKGKTLFSIDKKSKGSEFSFTIPPEKKELTDPLAKGIQSILDFTQSEQKKFQGTELEGRNILLSAVEDIVTIPANLLNLGGQIASEQKGREQANIISIPKTSTDAIVSPIVEGGVKSFETGSPKPFLKGFEKSGQDLVKFAKEKGIPSTVGGLSTNVGLGAPVIEKIAVKSIPFRIAKLGETKIISNVLTGKPIATISKTGKVSSGFKASDVDLDKIVTDFSSRAKGGAELDAIGSIESKVLGRKDIGEALVKAGKLTEDDISLIQAGKIGVRESKDIPSSTFRKDFTSQPFSNIPSGKPTIAIKEFFRKENIVLEGSGIDITTFKPRFVGQAGDFDVKVKSLKQGQELAERATRQLNKASEGTPFTFKVKSAKIEAFKGGKLLGKAGEFLAPDDPQAIGQISKTGSVFGVKTSKKIIKVEGIKQKTRNFQINRRTASVTSLQLTKGGVKVGPPINKPGEGPNRAKDFPRLFAGLKTNAEIAQELGQTQKALRLEQSASEVLRVGSKDIDFEKFFKERRITDTFTIKENKGLLSKIRDASGVLSKDERSLIQSSKISSGVGSNIVRSSPSISSISNPSIRSSLSKSSGSASPSILLKGSGSPSLSGASPRTKPTFSSRVPSITPRGPSGVSYRIPKSPTIPKSPLIKSPTIPKSPASPNDPAFPIPKPIIPIIIPPVEIKRRDRLEPPRDGPRRSLENFLGSSSIESVIGITKGDFTFGKKSDILTRKRIAKERKRKTLSISFSGKHKSKFFGKKSFRI